MDSTQSRHAHSPEPASDDSASPFNFSPAEERAYWRGVADGLARAGSPAPVAPRAAAPAPAAVPPGEPLPWEGDPPEEAGRHRHDAFTGAKKQTYLKALAKSGCILDACKITGISSSTVYNHQASDPEFDRNCQLAIGMAATPIELTAYERAVVGHEEPVIRGGKIVGTRIKRSDYMLRILLQGADPKKYGPRPGFTRKRLLKAERQRIEREVRAEIAEDMPTFEDSITALDEALESFGRNNDRKRAEQGWTDLCGGIWVPPGWVWAGEGDPNEAAVAAMEKIHAVSNSSNSSTSQAGEEKEIVIPAKAGIHEHGSSGFQPATFMDPDQEFPSK